MNSSAITIKKCVEEFVNSESLKRKKQKEKVFKKGILWDFSDQITAGWYIADLFDVTHLITCGVAKRPEYVEEGIPFLSAQNARPFKTNLNKIRYIDEDTFKKITVGGKPEKGDILYTRVGNCGEAATVPYDFDFGVYVSLTLIKPNNLFLYSDYLTAFLNSRFGVMQASQGAIGIGLKNLNVDNVRRYKIPLPPLPEQKRIVEKLDSLLAQVDTIQQRLNNLPDIIKRFRQSVLAAAVSGKLTEQWRKVNEISKPKEVLESLLQARRETWEEEQLKSFQRKEKPPENNKWKNKYKCPKEGYLDEYDTTIIKDVSKDWLVSNLDSVSIMVTGKTPSTTDETNWDGETPFISPSQITKEGGVTAPKRYVSSIGAANTPILPKNSVLVVCIGTIGKVGLLDKEAAFNQQINAMIPVNGMNKMFLFYWSKTLHSWLNKTSSAVVNAAIINKSRLSIAPCPVPSIEEQTEIVRLVEQYFALADTLEKNLANAKQRVDNLTQSILAKAFKGELVPQDESDEPADKLLDRIKAARQEAEKLEKAAKASAKKAAKASKASKT